MHTCRACESFQHLLNPCNRLKSSQKRCFVILLMNRLIMSPNFYISTYVFSPPMNVICIFSIYRAVRTCLSIHAPPPCFTRLISHARRRSLFSPCSLMVSVAGDVEDQGDKAKCEVSSCLLSCCHDLAAKKGAARVRDDEHFSYCIIALAFFSSGNIDHQGCTHDQKTLSIPSMIIVCNFQHFCLRHPRHFLSQFVQPLQRIFDVIPAK